MLSTSLSKGPDGITIDISHLPNHLLTVVDIEALCSGLAGEATAVEGVPGIALTGFGRRGLQRLDAGGLGDGEGDGGGGEG